MAFSGSLPEHPLFLSTCLSHSGLNVIERSCSNFWANWTLLYVRGSSSKHSSKNTMSASAHLGFPPRPGFSQSPSTPSFFHLCKTSRTVCAAQLKWAAIFSTYQPCALNLMTSAGVFYFLGYICRSRTWKEFYLAQKSEIPLTGCPYPCYLGRHIYLFTYLYTVLFFHLVLLTSLFSWSQPTNR